MKVTVKPFGPVRRVCGVESFSLEMEVDATINDVISGAIKKVGPRLEELLMDNGQVSGNFIIMLNKRDINTLSGLHTIVHDGDEIAILPHVQGGR